MYTTTNLGLVVWDSNSDTFNHTQLAANWAAIDAWAGGPIQATKSVQVVTSLPVSSLFEGELCYLSSAASGFAAGTVLRYTSSVWKPVPGVEVLAAVPSSGNFAGRLVLLSANDSGFTAWSLIGYNGSSWALTNRSYEILTAVPGSGNFAGRLVLLTSTSGGFPAFSLIRFDGSAWALVGPQPVPPATQLALFTSTTALTTTATSAPGSVITTFTPATFENVPYYLQIIIPGMSHTVASANMTFGWYESSTLLGFAVIQMPATIGNTVNLNVFIPYTPSAATHTFNVAWYNSTAGTATIPAASIQGASIFRIIKA